MMYVLLILLFLLVIWFHRSIRHVLFQFKRLVLFHWSIRHILFQFKLRTLCIHLLIYCSCLLLFLCVWCWLRATSLLVPPADADSEQCTTHCPSNECHQWADNSRNGCSSSGRQTCLWNRNKDQGVQIYNISKMGPLFLYTSPDGQGSTFHLLHTAMFIFLW